MISTLLLGSLLQFWGDNVFHERHEKHENFVLFVCFVEKNDKNSLFERRCMTSPAPAFLERRVIFGKNWKNLNYLFDNADFWDILHCVVDFVRSQRNIR